MKRLRTIAGILMRDMQRSFTPEQIESYTEQFSLYTKVLLQKRSDKDKIYSLHEPHIYAMAKGKDHKSYEFGVKASVATTYTHRIVIGAVAHETNEHDSKTSINGYMCLESEKMDESLHPCTFFSKRL